jgi:hypothetical protein
MTKKRVAKSERLMRQQLKRYEAGTFGCDLELTYAIAEALYAELEEARAKQENAREKADLKS